jgi:HAD superfamily hydrolase (TIGR01549 family)
MVASVTVLFDLEDTLVQTPWSNYQHVVEFRHRTKQKLVSLGIPPMILAGIERATTMRNKASEYVEQKLSRAKTENFKLEMEKFVGHYEEDSAEKSRLFPDTIPTLRKLRRLGIKMGLVTNTSAKATSIIFQMHGLRKYFDVVITRENVKRLKPDPEGILLALKQLGANKFFMVGDLALDILAARGANGLTILLKRPKQSDSQDLFRSLPTEVLEKTESFREQGNGLRANYVIQSLEEIPAIIQEKRNNRPHGQKAKARKSFKYSDSSTLRV